MQNIGEENEQIEFKKSTSELKEGIISIASILNKHGSGELYFGVMETFATGLKRIKDLCDEAGCKVEFRMEVDDFVVAFYRNLREEWNSAGKGTNESLGM